jgi:microcin C transport system substrate-binding protein
MKRSMSALIAGLIGAAALLPAAPAAAQEWQSVSSLIGPSKYAGNFQHYDYVNPDAPKGGTISAAAIGTFDSFNPFIVRGTPAAGFGQTGGLAWETLMSQSLDEPGVSHGLLAEALKFPADFSSATYRLNANARWHDGKPVTADDVVWSFNALKKESPFYNRYFGDVTEAVALSEREVEFRFAKTGNRELPHIMGDLAVLPKHWWEGTDAQGKKRDIAQPTLEPPLGSGPYRVASFRPGAEIIWERVSDYWGADLPVNVGRENVDRQRFTYFTDENAAWQAFTKGGVADYRFENRAQKWATEYNFPAFQAGDAVKREFPTTSTEPMQAYVMNVRRPIFQDRRVREALTYAFDFESMNRTLFYGLYTRTDSYFEGGELASSGLPQGKELEILNEVKEGLPPEVFTEEFRLPVYDSPEAARSHLRRAFQLLSEAGWKRQPGGNTLVNARGEPFRIELLGDDASAERVALPFIDSLRRLGIEASLRIVDTNQYVNRVRSFDYDMLAIASFGQSSSPGNEQRNYWGSAAADAPGSDNLIGVKDPAIDKLIERVIFATDREDLIAATHALDRALLWNYFVVPQWHNPKIWGAHWKRVGIPEKQPGYVGVDPASWWIVPEADAELTQKYGSTAQ